MHILFRHLDPGKSGAVSSMVKMLEAYSLRFPNDRLSVMCASTSPLADLARLPNCDAVFIGQKVPREAHLLGFGDIAVRRLHHRSKFDIFWCVNVGLYVPGGPTQVMTMNNPHQVYPVDPAVPHLDSPLRSWMLRTLFRRSLRLSAAVIVQTQLMRSLTRAIPGCPELVAVVPKAVVDSNSDGQEGLSTRLANLLAPAADSKKLVYVATAAAHKNHKILEPVMQEFRRRNMPITLVVTISAEKWVEFTGEGGASLIKSGHVVPLSWVDKSELQSLYAACDISIMPSLTESLSSTHIEAMQWRCPQVTSDLPYAHDLCHDAALYASPHDPSAWCAQVESLLGDPELRQQMIIRGTERIKDFPPSWSAMAEAIRPVFESVIASTANK